MAAPQQVMMDPAFIQALQAIASTSVPSTHRIPAKEPEMFSGKKSDVLESWLFDMVEYLQTDSVFAAAITDETSAECTRKAGSYLTGKAKTWFIQWTTMMAETAKVRTWNSFKTAFTKAHTAQDQQVQIIKQMILTSPTTGLENYIDSFTTLKNKLTMTAPEEWYRAAFQIGLDNATNAHIDVQNPKTLERTQEFARLAQPLVSLQTIQRKTYNGNPRKDLERTRTKSNRTNHQYKRFNDTKQVDNAAWLKEITCYNCKEKGHYSNKCPNAKIPADIQGNE